MTDTSSDQGLTAAEAAELRAQLADLQAGKAVAESAVQTERRARRNAEMANMSAQERAVVSALDACESNLQSRESDIETFENRIAELADEPGHGKEIAQLNRKMGEAITERADLIRQKAFYTTEREKFKTAPRGDEESARTTGKLLANGIDTGVLSKAEQEWLERHPKAFSDQRYADSIVLAAQKATKVGGKEAHTPDYFRFIEAEIGDGSQSRQAEEGDDEGDELTIEAEPQVKAPQRRAAGPGSMAPAAPPTRSTPTGGSGGQRRTPALNAEEREVADQLYNHMANPADRYLHYAKNKKLMSERVPSHFTSH